MINFKQYVSSHLEYINTTNQLEIETLTSCLLEQIDTGSTIYTLGNGGSHATAEHFSADLNLTLQRTGHSLRSICVSSQISSSTALANDYNFSSSLELFLKNFLNTNDVVIAFSASGNSANIIRALESASEISSRVFSLTGFEGGKCKLITNANSIHFETPVGSYGIVENIHLAVCHYIIDKITEFDTV